MLNETFSVIFQTVERRRNELAANKYKWLLDLEDIILALLAILDIASF